MAASELFQLWCSIALCLLALRLVLLRPLLLCSPVLLPNGARPMFALADILPCPMFALACLVTHCASSLSNSR